MEVLIRLVEEVRAAARVHRIRQKQLMRFVRIVSDATLEEEITVSRRDFDIARAEEKAMAGVVSGAETSSRLLVRFFGKQKMGIPRGVQGDVTLFCRWRSELETRDF